MTAYLPGQTTRTFAVTANSNLVAEGNETFTVLLTTAIHVKIIGNTGLATITNDD